MHGQGMVAPFTGVAHQPSHADRRAGRHDLRVEGDGAGPDRRPGAALQFPRRVKVERPASRPRVEDQGEGQGGTRNGRARSHEPAVQGHAPRQRAARHSRCPHRHQGGHQQSACVRRQRSEGVRRGRTQRRRAESPADRNQQHRQRRHRGADRRRLLRLRGQERPARRLSALTTSIDSRLNALLQVYRAEGELPRQQSQLRQQRRPVRRRLPATATTMCAICDFYLYPGRARLLLSPERHDRPVDRRDLSVGRRTGQGRRRSPLYGRNLPGGKIDPNSVVNDRPLEKAIVTVKARADPIALQRLAYTGF